MKRTFTLPSLMLTSATANTSAQSAEFASADCVTGLNEIGLICVNNISGSQQDVEHAIAVQADEQGASWYRIVQMYEEQQPDNWRVQAILYACGAWRPRPIARNSKSSSVCSSRRMPPRVSSIIRHQASASGGEAKRNTCAPTPSR